MSTGKNKNSTRSKMSFKEKLRRAQSEGDIAAVFMMLPAVILLAVVSIYPFCWLFRYMFFDYNGINSYFVGLHNFDRMLHDTTFWLSVAHTFEYVILKLIFIIPLSLLMAVFINFRIKGSSFFRGVYFMPTIISVSVSSLVFSFILSAYNGILNASLVNLGIIDTNINWLGDSHTAMGSVIMVAVWAGFGNYMIYFLSGMSSISEDVYEAAKIDGASEVQSFFKITIPLLSPMLKVILMLAITGAFKDYESIMVLTQGGPNDRTQVMFLYIYQLFFGSGTLTQPQIGYATVLSITAAMIIGIVTAIYLYAARKLDEVV